MVQRFYWPTFSGDGTTSTKLADKTDCMPYALVLDK